MGEIHFRETTDENNLRLTQTQKKVCWRESGSHLSERGMKVWTTITKKYAIKIHNKLQQKHNLYRWKGYTMYGTYHKLGIALHSLRKVVQFGSTQNPGKVSVY